MKNKFDVTKPYYILYLSNKYNYMKAEISDFKYLIDNIADYYNIYVNIHVGFDNDSYIHILHKSNKYHYSIMKIFKEIYSGDINTIVNKLKMFNRNLYINQILKS